jgi:hypothetical protein
VPHVLKSTSVSPREPQQRINTSAIVGNRRKFLRDGVCVLTVCRHGQQLQSCQSSRAGAMHMIAQHYLRARFAYKYAP